MFDAESVDWARQVAGAVWLGSSHRAPGSEDVVHSLWRVSCGGDATLIGRSAETIPFDLAVPSPGRILVYRENRSGTRSIEILDLLAKGDTFESLVAASPEPVGFEAPRYDPVRTGGRQEGEVRAAVRLDSEGRVSDVRCHGGTERLRAEVARVARAWRYAPTRESPRDAFVTFRFRIDETLGMGSKPVTARMSRNSYEVVGSLPRDSWIEDPFVSRRKPSTR